MVMRGGGGCASPREGNAQQLNRKTMAKIDARTQRLWLLRANAQTKDSFTTVIWAFVTNRIFPENFQLKAISQFYPERPPIARDHVFAQKGRSGIAIMPVEQVVNAAGKVQTFDQVLSEKSEVDHSKAGRLGALEREPFAGVLEFQARKHFLLHQRSDHVQLAQLFGRIRAHNANLMKLRILHGVTDAASQAGSPPALQFQFNSFGRRAVHI